jgi:HEAT repeat protein
MAVVSVIALQYSAEATGETKGSHEVDRLMGDLKEPSWQIRWYAAEALGEIKDPRAVEPLIAALKDKIKDVRR